MTCQDKECGGDVVSLYAEEPKAICFAINDEWVNEFDAPPPFIKGRGSDWKSKVYGDGEEHPFDHLFLCDVDFMFCLKCHKVQGLEDVTSEEIRRRYEDECNNTRY